MLAIHRYEVIAKVPVILHTPLMSGSNFVHGIVLVGAMVALGNAATPLEKSIGFIGVLLAAVTRSVAMRSPSACWRCSNPAHQGKVASTARALLRGTH